MMKAVKSVAFNALSGEKEILFLESFHETVSSQGSYCAYTQPMRVGVTL